MARERRVPRAVPPTPRPGCVQPHQDRGAAATPYLHSVTLQQQLPLRRPRRSERSSVLDFLRLKYSVSFPNEAMAPATSERAPACSRGHRSHRTLTHATLSLPRALHQLQKQERRAAGPGESTRQDDTSQEPLVGPSTVCFTASP